MAETTSASRVRALLNKFEGVKEPPPPPKDRIQSTLDAPRPQLGEEAKAARVKSITLAAEETQTADPKRYVPRISPADSDEIRELKRAIQAKEQEIMHITDKLSSISTRLDRAIETFAASTVEVAAEAAPVKPAEDRVKAFQSDSTGATEQQKKTAAESSSSPSLSGGTSLAAILAAARSGGQRVKSEKPKYAKLLRDMK